MAAKVWRGRARVLSTIEANGTPGAPCPSTVPGLSPWRLVGIAG